MTRNRLPERVLLVEGKDDSAVIQSLCRHHDLPETFAVQPKAGVISLLDGIPLEIRRRTIRRLGIVVDADSDPTARWAAVQGVLRTEGYDNVPDIPPLDGTILVGRTPLSALGIWLMPDNGSPGALEHFAAALVPPGDFLWSHASGALDGIPDEHRRFGPTERAKAHVHTWLAWQRGPGSPMGQAITKGHLDARAEPAVRFAAWLRRLFVDEVPG